jgi:hypothetical protein
MANGTAVESSLPADPPLVDDVELPLDDPTPEPSADAAIEARAREMGWKPLVEYRGPPGRWQPAADFIQRGENILPIVRDQNRRLTERVGKLEGEISGLRSSAAEQLQIIKDLRDLGQRQNKAGYDRAMAEINAKKTQARASGDVEAYAQLVEQAEALGPAPPPQPTATAAEPAKPATPTPPPLSEATKAFFDANSWFQSDAFLQRKMVDAHLDVMQEGEIVSESEQYAEAKQRIMDAYPERFGGQPPVPRPAPTPRPAARRAAAVARPTAEPPAPPAVGTTINSITDPAERAEARAAFDRMKRQGIFKTEAEYMALYTDPHGDVLEKQQASRSQPNGR